jgi:predicted dehydrogenase
MSQAIRIGTRREVWAPAEEEVFDYSTVPDRSWALEWQDFVDDIIENRQPVSRGYDGWRAVVMAYAVYESSETGKAVEMA